jgi:hypothetical protein
MGIISLGSALRLQYCNGSYQMPLRDETKGEVEATLCKCCYVMLLAMPIQYYITILLSNAPMYIMLLEADCDYNRNGTAVQS